MKISNVYRSYPMVAIYEVKIFVYKLGLSGYASDPLVTPPRHNLIDWGVVSKNIAGRLSARAFAAGSPR